VTLAANAVLNNFLLFGAFFLDGLANAAEQLCGRAYGARDRAAFSGAVRLVILWGFAFALAVAAIFALFGPGLIAIMTASEAVRHGARDYLRFVVLSPLLAVFAFGYDGVYIGATWAREMRNLMMLSLVIFLAAWLALRPFGNAGLWGALLAHYAARGGLQALRYPAMLRASFPRESKPAES
jgi:MATE family multidrug resistance protein